MPPQPDNGWIQASLGQFPFQIARKCPLVISQADEVRLYLLNYFEFVANVSQDDAVGDAQFFEFGEPFFFVIERRLLFYFPHGPVPGDHHD